VSHELLEAITDPGVGLNRVACTTRQPARSADICAFTSAAGTRRGRRRRNYTVQRS